MNNISYRTGYKYQLAKTYVVKTGITTVLSINTEFISLETDGVLTIRNGYSWDGPSGPTIDTANFMRGSLVHDALYQLIRQELLSEESRIPADMELKRICKEDGMSSIRAWWVIKGLKYFGGPAASPKNRKVIYHAPKPKAGKQ